MMVFKRKQIVVLSLVLMIVVAGYLQYSYKKSGTAVTQGSDKAAKTVSASKQANDFFAQARLDREVTRGKDTDALKSISNDPNAPKEAKTKAYDKAIRISENSQKEMRIENLVKEKGFNDVVVLFGDDGSIDIVVKSPSLTSAQTAQIADIVMRQANVPMSKIHIKSLF